MPHHTLGMLHGLVSGIIQHPTWRWTLVGVHELLREVPHAMPAMSAWAAVDVSAYIEQEAGTRVTFLGREEYARRRGATALMGE